MSWAVQQEVVDGFGCGVVACALVHKQCRMQGDCVIVTSRPPLLVIWDLQWILHFYIAIHISHLKVPGPFHNMISGTRFLFCCVFHSASARLWKRLMLRFHLQSPAVATALAGASGSGARFQVLCARALGHKWSRAGLQAPVPRPATGACSLSTPGLGAPRGLPVFS